MKRFLLILCVILFTGLSANAGTTLYYSHTGYPMYVQRGAGPMVSTHTLRVNPQMRSMVYRNNFARPYGMHPYARDRFAHVRGMNPQMPYGGQMVMNSIAPVHAPANAAVTSRLNKNYKPQVQKTSTRNGMVYYN